MGHHEPGQDHPSLIPAHEDEAMEWLMELVHAVDEGRLRQVRLEDFKRGWSAIAFIYPGLHPDETQNHGPEMATDRLGGDQQDIHPPDQRLSSPYYVESGWPVILAPIADEAWQRYESGQLEEDEFYNAEVAIARLESNRKRKM